LLHCFRCQASYGQLLDALGLTLLDFGMTEASGHVGRRRASGAAVLATRAGLERLWADALNSPRLDAALRHAERVLLCDSSDLVRLGTGESEGRLVFAVRDDAGRLVGLERYAMPESRARRELRHGAPKLLAAAGSRRSLWPAPVDVRIGEHLDRTLVVCEGAPAAATLAGCGLSAISFPNSAGLSGSDVGRIASRFLRAIVLADADRVGRAGASVSARLLREHGVAAVMVDLFPGVDDHRDAADVLRFRAVFDGLTSSAAGAWLAKRLEIALGAT
jgi:hypothetical protein